MSFFFTSPRNVFASAIMLRVGMLLWGVVQDEYSPMKYTDIDYFVFTDASRFVAHGKSPYARDTYRYTPLLAWLLLPTTWGGAWFSFGKVLFATADIVAGLLVMMILRSSYGMNKERALKFASIWLLNPMVANISTRGSSEGLLGILATALLWFITQKQMIPAGLILGLAVHFKIYPFIYAFSIIWWLDRERLETEKPASKSQPSKTLLQKAIDFPNGPRVTLAVTSLSVFMALNLWMYQSYGWPFVQHSYLHHLTRIDHRHNFSPYSTVLYLNSSPASRSSYEFESVAFLPQLLLSAIIIPLAFAKSDLASTMLAQTFAFVTFNKVCTSQYFLWYLIFLPFYLPSSTLLQKPRIGVVALAAWVLGQAAWLQQGYQLEFLGNSTFVPGLWIASLLFFLVNIWILGIIFGDISRGNSAPLRSRIADKQQ